MKGKAVRSVLLIAILGAGFITTSCSSGPEPPRPGTPAFYWAAAKETYAAGDYLKATEHVEAVCRTQNDLTPRAQVWFLVMSSGIVRSYMDFGDYFEYGAKARAMNPAQFRRESSNARTLAKRLSLEFAQVFQDFQKNNKDPKVTLDFVFPEGSALPSPMLTKIGHGDMPAPAVLDDVRRQHMKTGIVLQTCRAVGAPEDTAKTQDLFKTVPVQVPRETFLLGMAQALHEDAELFGRAKLDEPDRLKMFESTALDTLKMIPQTKETTALSTKIQKALKLAAAK